MSLKEKAKTLNELLWKNRLEWDEWLRMGVTEQKSIELASKYQELWVRLKDAEQAIAELKQKLREALKHVVYLGVTCKGCNSLGKGINDCLDYAIKNNIQDRERCKRVKEAWKLLEGLKEEKGSEKP
jgi:hypothetical protein